MKKIIALLAAVAMIAVMGTVVSGQGFVEVLNFQNQGITDSLVQCSVCEVFRADVFVCDVYGFTFCGICIIPCRLCDNPCLACHQNCESSPNLTEANPATSVTLAILPTILAAVGATICRPRRKSPEKERITT